MGGRVITITHYTHFKFLLSKFSQIMAKIIIMNVGIDKTSLKFKFSQEIINIMVKMRVAKTNAGG